MPRVTTPAVFDPSKIGVVTAYPLTQEAWNNKMGAAKRNTAAAVKSGRATRKGVPNGYSGKKGRERAKKHRFIAQETADTIAVQLLPAAPPRNALTDDERLTLMDECREMTEEEMGDFAI